jgi:hypothetical protein
VLAQSRHSANCHTLRPELVLSLSSGEVGCSRAFRKGLNSCLDGSRVHPSHSCSTGLSIHELTVLVGGMVCTIIVVRVKRPGHERAADTTTHMAVPVARASPRGMGPATPLCESGI